MSDKDGAIKIESCRRECLADIRHILEDAPEAAMWSEEALARTLENAAEPLLVAWSANQVAGFILGRMMAGEAEILNLAVKRGYRRLGVGTALMEAMLVQCERSGCAKVFLEVRESNRAAIRFYDRLGFREVGVRAGYYRDPVEAALVLEKVTQREPLVRKIHRIGTE